MNLYLDDDCIKASLVAKPTKAGHRVILPADSGLIGASDPRHMTEATQLGIVLLTRNHDDFEDLHVLVAGHSRG